MELNKIDRALASILENRKAINLLKQAVIIVNDYEVAADIRDIERINFPESDQTKEIKLDSIRLSSLFKMVGLNVSEKQCYMISEALTLNNKKKGKFTIDDATKIKSKASEIFFNED